MMFKRRTMKTLALLRKLKENLSSRSPADLCGKGIKGRKNKLQDRIVSTTVALEVVVGSNLCVPISAGRRRQSCSCQQSRGSRVSLQSSYGRSSSIIPTGRFDRRGATTSPAVFLFYAVQYGDSALLRQLLDNVNVDVNELNEDGISILHFAAIVGFKDCILALHERGACVNLCDVRGQSPLHYAIMMERPEAIDCLRRLGAVYS